MTLALNGQAAQAAQLIESAFEEEALADDLGLMTGLTGVLYAAHFCETAKIRKQVKKRRKSLEALLPKYLDRFGRFELMTGATGFGVYARRTGDDFALKCVLDYLKLSLEQTEFGMFWLAPPKSRDSTKSRPLDLGMAHGVCGPISLLSRMVLEGERYAPQAEELLVEILPAVKKIIKKVGDRRIPAWFPDHHRAGFRRSSWCYGSAGSGFAIALMGKALSDDRIRKWGEAHIVEGLRLPVREFRENGGLCHGPSAQALVAWCAGREFNLDLGRAISKWMTKEEKIGMGLNPERHPPGVFGLGGYRLLQETLVGKISGQWGEIFLLL